MNMKFSIKQPVVFLPVEQVHKVELSLEVSTTDKECMYLKANGKTIMGFKNGMYCRYTDAAQSSVNDKDVQGLVLEGKGRIVQAENNF